MRSRNLQGIERADSAAVLQEAGTLADSPESIREILECGGEVSIVAAFRKDG